MIKKLSVVAFLLSLISFSSLSAQNESYNNNKFRQLYNELPTPNVYRTASGAPGHKYWQQKADYIMDIRLDDKTQKIYGEETITYTNNSPDKLSYLWVQLDQNVREKDGMSKKVRTMNMKSRMGFDEMERAFSEFDGGFKIEKVTDKSGRDLAHTINETMMRVDLPTALSPKGSVTFKIKWWYNINDRKKIGGRSGYEHFKSDDNYLYTIAQFFPRMCQYSDVEGWQNKQFLGRGEFALSFGDYTVNITVPADHIVASTGELQNASACLTSTQRDRFDRAKTSAKPLMIVTPQEAKENESSRSTKEKTWTYKAKNVRDFAFASSRKFIWDAMGVKQSGGTGPSTVMAMSYYPNEGNPLWEQYSTEAVAQTLETYSKHTFDYPYPVAISVHSDRIGMEYPMICFNGGRPESDGTYSERTRTGMITVIIHEVGHNYFPMIVASDERQWTWMDEGLNTFLQYLTEQEFDRYYPSRRGEARNIVDYMKGDKSRISPIMTNSESIYQFGNNAYGKPATALNILRETVMGRELFDHAFKEYSNRWMFKHPSPADFFRTMEDASAVDLDWFWRGWFYTNEHVDLSIEEVQWFKINNQEVSAKAKEAGEAAKSQYDDRLGFQRNKIDIPKTRTENDKSLEDFYTTDQRFQPTEADQKDRERLLSSLNESEKSVFNSTDNFYAITFANKGGLPMPLIVEFSYADGSTEIDRIPAEIWKFDDEEVTKVFRKSKEVTNIRLDPFQEVADVDMGNNAWPNVQSPTRFELFKRRQRGGENPMQRALKKGE